MKKRQPASKQPYNPLEYDTLLEEFLPVIHQAAYSVVKSQQPEDTPKDLLLAGLRGLKEAFLQIRDNPIRREIKDVFLHAIYYSIMKQFRTRQNTRESMN